jgi:hypothetical protein
MAEIYHKQCMLKVSMRQILRSNHTKYVTDELLERYMTDLCKGTALNCPFSMRISYIPDVARILVEVIDRFAEKDLYIIPAFAWIQCLWLSYTHASTQFGAVTEDISKMFCDTFCNDAYKINNGNRVEILSKDAAKFLADCRAYYA